MSARLCWHGGRTSEVRRRRELLAEEERGEREGGKTEARPLG